MKRDDKKDKNDLYIVKYSTNLRDLCLRVVLGKLLNFSQVQYPTCHIGIRVYCEVYHVLKNLGKHSEELECYQPLPLVAGIIVMGVMVIVSLSAIRNYSLRYNFFANLRLQMLAGSLSYLR